MEEVAILLPVVALALLEGAWHKVLVEEVEAPAQLWRRRSRRQCRLRSDDGTALQELVEAPAPLRRTRQWRWWWVRHGPRL
jgi:hypothetical protein